MNDEQISQQAPSPEPSSPGPFFSRPDPMATAQAYQLGAQAVAATQAYAQAMIENTRLRDRLAQKELKESAYTSAHSSSGRTYTTGTTGRVVEVLDAEIEKAIRLDFRPPYSRREVYVIALRGHRQNLTMDSEQFNCDRLLVQAFREFPGLHVPHCRTTRQTADLLRQAIADRIEVIQPAFWGGWHRCGEQAFAFGLLPNGSTHATPNGPIGMPVPAAPLSEAVASISVSRFLGSFQMQSPCHETWLLWLIFHTAALYSLLRGLSYPFPLAFFILVDHAVDQSKLENLFEWYGDPLISLCFPPEIVMNKLLRRKDQPLLILDDRGGKAAARNATALETVLSSQQVPWRKGREERHFPLQALPVILSTAASSLAVHPNIVVLELPSDNFCVRLDADGAVRAEYLHAFIRFTGDHITHLQNLLEKEGNQALSWSKSKELTTNCVKAASILLAVNSFVREFYRSLGQDVPALECALADNVDWLLDLMAQTSEKLLDYGDLAAQFVDVARSMLEAGALCPCPVKYEEEPASNAVYFDEGSLGFTISAMTKICQQLGQSRPVVLRALAQANLLQGKPVNSGTLLTRIGIWNVYGIRKTQRVYKLPRSAFDALGDPLTFEGEGF